MYLFFERGIRGGYSNIHKNYSKANHKYSLDYDENKESKYLWYVDMKSLYPSVMTEPMPVRDFRWATLDEINNIFKLCTEGRYDEISPYTYSVNFKHDSKNFDKEKMIAMCPDFYKEDGVRKLTHNLFDKKNYVIHYRTLIKFF